MAFAEILVPKLRSNGDGAPPFQKEPNSISFGTIPSVWDQQINVALPPVPAAYVPVRSSCSQTLPSLLQCTAGR